METYLVGGAVRDKLLGLSVHERDWVVVGARPEELLDAGYQAVGKDFPVFLHPETKEEYALARTERKTGSGYHGFACHFSTDVTLEEDLARRDLTINAIAQDQAGNLIDPYKGQVDLANKTLRHITEAFKEDPLRVLRVARFSARFEYLEFSIATETMALMQQITASGELNTISRERVWREFERALQSRSPGTFLRVLAECGALGALLNHRFCDPTLITGAAQLLDDLAPQGHPATRLAQVCLLYLALESDEHLLWRQFTLAFGLPKTLVKQTEIAIDNPLLLSAPSHHEGEAIYQALLNAGAFRQGDTFDALMELHALWAQRRQSKGVSYKTKWERLAQLARSVDKSNVSANLMGAAIGQAIQEARITVLGQSS